MGGWRYRTAASTREKVHDPTREFVDRYVGDMLERCRTAPMLVGECRPELHAVQTTRVLQWRALGMRDGIAGRHHVHSASAEHRFIAQAVIVKDLAFKKPC